MQPLLLSFRLRSAFPMGLETKIVTLQEQIAQLTLALLQERERSVEQRLTTLESLMQAFIGKQMPNLPVPEPRQDPAGVVLPTHLLHPAAQLARSRRPPLIEYCASGIYVIESITRRRGASRASFARGV
jgi:hypothetical protein